MIFLNKLSLLEIFHQVLLLNPAKCKHKRTNVYGRHWLTWFRTKNLRKEDISIQQFTN